LGLLTDILTALDKWDLWKEIKTAPERIAELEKRVANLEQLLGGKAPPDICRHCGERGARYERTVGSAGHQQELWKCEKCGHTNRRPAARQ
jgi:hypothetical protein